MQFLITMTDIEGAWDALGADEQERVLKRHDEFRAALEAEGRFVLACHLHPREEARTVRMDAGGRTRVEEGPYSSAAEGVGADKRFKGGSRVREGEFGQLPGEVNPQRRGIQAARCEKVLCESPSLLQDRFREELARLEGWERHWLLSALERIAAMMDAERIKGRAGSGRGAHSHRVGRDRAGGGGGAVSRFSPRARR